MATCLPANCSSWGALQANSEVAGIGVITGFMATAYITLAMVIVHYLFDHGETRNPVDRVIIDGAAGLWKSIISDRAKPTEHWSIAIEAAVVMFSDQQLVTGIGILVSGYTQISCSLSTYHWQIVVYLAWFSSLTHLTTLTALREFFRKQPTLAYWRVFFMGCTITLLGTALGPTGYVAQLQSSDATGSSSTLAVPALCLFSTAGYTQASSSPSVAQYDSGYSLAPINSLFILLSLLFLLVSYVSRVVKLFDSTSSIAKFWLRTRPGNSQKTSILRLLKRSEQSKGNIFPKLLVLLAAIDMTFYVVLKVIYEIGESMMWEIFWLIAALAWGTIRLLALRSHNHAPEEDVWGFGQILALLLIALPFLSLSEQLFTKSENVSLYPTRSHTATTLSRVNTARSTGSGTDSSTHATDERRDNGLQFTRSGASSAAHPADERTSEARAAFENLHLEKMEWYRNLGLLTFGMAILIAGDFLYDFPSAPLTRDSYGTNALTYTWPAIVVEYVIWYGLIAAILLVYTAVCITFDRWLWERCCRRVFGENNRARRIGLKVGGYLLIVGLLAGTMVFNVYFFYLRDPAAIAYDEATRVLEVPIPYFENK